MEAKFVVDSIYNSLLLIISSQPKKVGLNMFLVPINILTSLNFSPSKIFLQLLVPIKFSIFTFGLSFKVNSYVEFIFLHKKFHKIHNIIRIFQKKNRFF